MVKKSREYKSICFKSPPRTGGGKRHYSNQSYIETEGRMGLRQGEKAERRAEVAQLAPGHSRALGDWTH